MSLPMSRMLLMPATLAVVPRRHRSVAVRGRAVAATGSARAQPPLGAAVGRTAPTRSAGGLLLVRMRRREGRAARRVVGALPAAKFIEEELEVGENMAEFLTVVAVDARGVPVPPARRILVIPGNPGIVGYYADFCEALWREAGGEAEVTCLGLLGHSTRRGLYKPGAVWSLEDQEEHVAQHVAAQSGQGPPLELVGHSIGAHLALEALRRRPRDVLQVAGVYPYLTNNEASREQKFLSRLVRTSWVVMLAGAVMEMVGWMYPILRRLVLLPLELGFAMGTAAAAITAVAMTRYDAVKNMCHLGRTELDALAAPPHWAVLVGFRARISMVFATDDYWAPLSLKAEVERRIPGLRTYLDTQHDHMFCTRTVASEDIARMVVHRMLAPAGKGRAARAARRQLWDRRDSGQPYKA